MEDVQSYQIEDCFAAYEHAFRKHPTLASLIKSYGSHADLRIFEYTTVYHELSELDLDQEIEDDETLVSQVAIHQHLVPEFCIARLVELKWDNYPEEHIRKRIVDEVASADKVYLKTWRHFLFSDRDSKPGTLTRLLKGCMAGIMAILCFLFKVLRKFCGCRPLFILAALFLSFILASFLQDNNHGADQKKQEIDNVISQISKVVKDAECSKEVASIGGKGKSFELDSWDFPELKEEMPTNRNQRWCFDTRNKMRNYYVELSQELFSYKKELQGFNTQLQDAFLKLDENKKKVKKPVAFNTTLFLETTNTRFKGSLKDALKSIIPGSSARITKEMQTFVDDTMSGSDQEQGTTCSNPTCMFGNEYYNPEVLRVMEISKLLLGFEKFQSLANKLTDAERRVVKKALEIRGFAREENHRAYLALSDYRTVLFETPIFHTIKNRIRHGREIFPQLLEENIVITRKAIQDTNAIIKWDYFADPGLKDYQLSHS
ncbi:hypothetical protein HYFRA_00004377 [Hymenoscyphus fraxineus]|uniref:Uncharacterized protein n=1 Tax=Hymenoscyphus fraxineus TaxID=746836 RepID=A0A9N9KYK0_9HELO|nr:hypothetical protein HYFRA_00004377 [Hymenoscyphus fraxineus]